MIRGTVTVAAALAVLAGLPGSTLAAPKRVPPRELISTGHFVGVRIGASPKDEALAVIQADDGSTEASLLGRVRGADGRLGPVQELSRNVDSNLPQRISFNSAGSTFLSWVMGGQAKPGQSASRPAGGLFTVPFSWSDPALCVRSAAVAFMPDGNPTVGCTTGATGAGSDTQLVAATATKADGTAFGTAQVVQAAVTKTTVVGDPLLQVGTDGSRALVWLTNTIADFSSTLTLKLAIAPAGQPYAAPKVVTSASSFGGFALLNPLDLAVLADGRVVVLYESAITPGFNNTSFAIYVPNGDLIGSGSLASALSSSSSARVERDGDSALFAWRTNSIGGNTPGVKVASLQAPASLTGEVTLADGGSASPTHLGVGANGQAFVGGVSGSGATTELLAWMRPAANKPFGGAIKIATKTVGTSFDMALDRHGSVAAAWADGLGPDRVMLGGVDAAGPSLSRLSIPGRLRVKRGGTFSVSATDPAGVKAIKWSFGDRGSADGGSARHSYRRPGRYRVVLVATDRSGQQAQVTRTIRVSR